MLGFILAISLFIGGTDQLQEQQPRPSPHNDTLAIGATINGMGFFCRTRQSAEQLQRAHVENEQQGNAMASLFVNTGQCSNLITEYTIIEAGETVDIVYMGQRERFTLLVVTRARDPSARLYMLTINPVERGPAPPPRAPSI